ncbi:MAG: hypothetical protein BWX61_00162 [Bacteroidetes bacterium ADurb.Bin035]|nr:DUF4476 domain-containing protein [Bacteroidales bacterium]OQC48437.1 MAG: hypothetical protein BWX61_00162 [Bacteroidetes bacterium ADurb.Bin035]HQC59207.1 DUF4476 domain-containing protein [Bacteroidales bacterium]
MKFKIFFLMFIITLISNNIYSQCLSQLTIFHQDGEKFWVIIDGVKQNTAPQYTIFLDSLKGDFVKVKIIFDNEKIKDINKTIPLKDENDKCVHSKYVIKKVKNEYVMRLYSYEPIIIESKNNELVNDVQLNNQQPQQELNVQQPQQVQQNLQLQQPANQNQQQGGIGATIIDPTTGQPISVNVSFNVPVTDPQNINQPQQEFSQNQVQKPIQTQVQNIEKQPQFQQQPQQISPTYYQPMSPEDFASAKASISSKSFEDSKLTLAKQIAASNHLTSKQVKEIMQLFSFEDSKLDFAKYAYKYVYDPNNYYIVNDAFKFSSSIDELNEFIKK